MRNVVCDGVTYVDKGKYVIIMDNADKTSIAKVHYAKLLGKRFFFHKNERHYIVE